MSDYRTMAAAFAAKKHAQQTELLEHLATLTLEDALQEIIAGYEILHNALREIHHHKVRRTDMGGTEAPDRRLWEVLNGHLISNGYQADPR